MSSTHVLIHSPTPQPAKKLRSCLSPPRQEAPGIWDAVSPVDEFLAILRPPSAASSEASSTYTEIDGQLVKRPKAVRWQGGDGCAVTSYFATWSAQDYDRTPLAPPSELERACVMPARGDRCLSFNELGEDDDDSDSEDVSLPRSPFATPEDSDSDSDADSDEEWQDTCERRRMMFARMCSLGREDSGPQFEGYRSLSATLHDLLASVGAADELDAIPHEEQDSQDADSAAADQDQDESESESDSDLQVASSSRGRTPPAPFHLSESVFARLREGSVDTEVGTPSLVSSADAEDSDGEGPRLTSPRGSAVTFLPTDVFKGAFRITSSSTSRSRSPERMPCRDPEANRDRPRDIIEHQAVR